MFLLVSKLPTDLQDVMHILPFWFNYLYRFFLVLAIALVAILLIFAVSRLINYLNVINEGKRLAHTKTARQMTRDEVGRKLLEIVAQASQTGNFRTGLHNMAALIKTYFEIALKQDIEEMTALEIKQHIVQRRELGDYFTDITVVQFSFSDPTAADLKIFLERAVKMIR